MTLSWEQDQQMWNGNENTRGIYKCQASVSGTFDGRTVQISEDSSKRSGSARFTCNDGTWELESGSESCDGKLTGTKVATYCSTSEPVLGKWVGWYLADLKRCSDIDGLYWWATQDVTNADCLAPFYKGYPSEDDCWRAQFRMGAGSSYNPASTHVSAVDERNLCETGTAYPWSNFATYGTQCKYLPDVLKRF
jgi:hypothetical protein